MEFPEAGTEVKVILLGESLDTLTWSAHAETDDPATGQWLIPWPSETQQLELTDGQGTAQMSLPPQAPSPVVHKKRWWNILLANPASYLDDDGSLDMVVLGLMERPLISIGPSWFRTWLIHFFIGLLLFSLFFKWRWRLRCVCSTNGAAVH